jgi:hypothetical protein
VSLPAANCSSTPRRSALFTTAQRPPSDYHDEELLGIATALGETAELLDTLEKLLEPPAVKGWLPKMQKVVFGTFLPSKDHDPARNDQFELVVAASATPQVPSRSLRSPKCAFG